MKNEKEIQAHPSFGQISFSRVTGTNDFYGSELKQDHYVTMRVKQSEVERSLSREWYFANGAPLIEVRMTAGQFAELITSMNIGDGVPCTIETINKQKVDKFTTQESRKEFVHRKFKDRMEEFAKGLLEKQAKAKEIVKKKTLSKEDVNNLSNQLEYLTQEITSNIPFFMECFQETMDEVVLEAKTEVENAIQHKINVLGLKALHQENKLLSNGKNE